MRRFPALLVVPVFLLAACGGDPSDTPPAAPSPSTSPSTSTSPSVSPSPVKPAFAAADGRNLSACADNTCEVIVRSGDVLRVRGDLGPLHVQVSGGLVTLSQTAASGFSSTVTGSVGARQQINNQVIFVIAVEGDRAVLRLQPA
ncbi:hypothetical protein [Cryptosporangium phraense]|uniref:DUF3060 domain-containing protein n=1 Tax=Cryptosporangium phraense TaxID=2593070 RepID=A0A545ADT9_9ACTN|nr:hypothetical protein [Cryptosporangium phraense]TQS39507.1 hypothetical protein FL583_39680 [Cryptosporangium phraense]